MRRHMHAHTQTQTHARSTHDAHAEAHYRHYAAVLVPTTAWVLIDESTTVRSRSERVSERERSAHARARESD